MSEQYPKPSNQEDYSNLGKEQIEEQIQKYSKELDDISDDTAYNPRIDAQRISLNLKIDDLREELQRRESPYLDEESKGALENNFESVKKRLGEAEEILKSTKEALKLGQISKQEYNQKLEEIIKTGGPIFTAKLILSTIAKSTLMVTFHSDSKYSEEANEALKRVKKIEEEVKHLKINHQKAS
ncbi:MAG: hypothetical protein M1355_00560 [Patescibacteria group bacterium]|nr:hypothetical protein [Patescibacteria group bacterium]